MSRLFPSSPEVVARHLSDRVSALGNRMTEHHTTADTMRKEREQVTPEGVSVVWENPQALRTACHESELAEQTFRDMQSCLALRNRALMKAYAHHAYCVVRSVISRSFDSVQLSLAQVAQVFAVALSPASHAPPGQLCARSVLATCHASNAPGLSPVARNWQVSP
jgi:hypothetical protein